MNTVEIGKAIAKARKNAGYSQKSLASCLFVTDKAVSKWERGVCLPNVSLFPKISRLLDIDLEHIISGAYDHKTHLCSGELCVDDVRIDVAGKPLIHYLLAYFMLAGITDISIITKDKDYVRGLNLEQYGLNISFFRIRSEKKMVIDGKFLLFGVNITRQFQGCMLKEDNISLCLGERMIPISFYVNGRRVSADKLEKKSLARGTVYIPMTNDEEVRDAAEFIEIYEKYHTNKISDLHEIAKLRGLIEN